MSSRPFTSGFYPTDFSATIQTPSGDFEVNGNAETLTSFHTIAIENEGQVNLVVNAMVNVPIVDPEA